MDGETPREQLECPSIAQALFLKRLHIKVNWQINSMEPGKAWAASQRGCSPSTEQEGASGKDTPTIPILFSYALSWQVEKKGLCALPPVSHLSACRALSAAYSYLSFLMEATAHSGWKPGVSMPRFKAWLHHYLVIWDKLPKPLLLF